MRGEQKMVTKVTARRFKAHPSLIEYAQSSINKLSKFYDGLIKGEIILSYEKSIHSVKVVKIILGVYGQEIMAEAKSEDFFKSIDEVVEKIEVQLKKYKAKLHDKNRKKVRTIREKA